jgi:alpha-D-xyloside xylohydrolase
MFGPALMPCPVYYYRARSRSVCFPSGGWYDFYTGAFIEGGRTREVAAPYARMPLYVRAGSIIPFGPEMEWCDQKPADAIRLYVYAGADADFKLYEDDGLTYAYEKGAFSTIPIHWDDASRTLTIGDRAGSFPGMLEQRSFHVVVVDPAHPHVYDPDAAGIVCEYAGKAVSL